MRPSVKTITNVGIFGTRVDLATNLCSFDHSNYFVNLTNGNSLQGYFHNQLNLSQGNFISNLIGRRRFKSRRNPASCRNNSNRDNSKSSFLSRTLLVQTTGGYFGRFVGVVANQVLGL